MAWLVTRLDAAKRHDNPNGWAAIPSDGEMVRSWEKECKTRSEAMKTLRSLHAPEMVYTFSEEHGVYLAE